jgi:hypothetical protein
MAPDTHPTNLVDRGIRRRRRLGAAWLIVGVIAAIALVASSASREWRLLLVIPFTISANGFLQAREKTCVILAAIGKREVNDGRSYADVADEERAVLRRRALMIALRSGLIAVVVTAAIWWIRIGG